MLINKKKQKTQFYKDRGRRVKIGTRKLRILETMYGKTYNETLD